MSGVWWFLIGTMGTLLGLGVLYVLWRWFRLRRYGSPIAHEETLVQYGHRMAGLLNREALDQLLTGDMSDALHTTRAQVLFVEEHELVAGSAPAPVQSATQEMRLPVHHAAVRWVAASGEAKPVTGQLQDLIRQGPPGLDWGAVWVPLMRGTDLHGLWLLGERAGGLAYAAEDLRWLTTIARQAAVVLETIRYAEQEKHVASEMQALYHQAVSARESERERLARELHDGVLQDLCSVSRDLKALESATRSAGAQDLLGLADLASRSNESVQSLRAICHDLRPPLLSNNPIMALKAMVERLDAQSPTPIHMDVSAEELSLSVESALAVYRIAQEALHNAIQHADASEIALRLTQYPDRLRMTVTDDGRGFSNGTDLYRFVAAGHFGLAGMRERAAMTGGSLDVQSAPDYGTVVILEIPC